jgi:TonB-linked SusC/RagA family outer membrane protein
MKKIDVGDRYVPIFRKTIRIMKMITILLLCFVCGISATTYAQNQKVSVNKKNSSILDILKEIEEQSEFTFFFNDNQVNAHKKTSVNVKNATLEEALDQILRNTDYEYRIIDRQVLIRISQDESLHMPAIQQQRSTISGIVKDQLGEPVIGANITEKGTTNGVITDIDGRFTLTVNPGSILQVSYIGYASQEITVGTNKILEIILSEDLQALDEVVVIGYGTQRKRDITGSVASVSDQEFADLALSDVSQALAGRIPGLDVVSSGASPGDAGSILLRGKRSFVASNDPLIILDGMTFYGELNDINPYDIKSIDVLKDASSTAIYGSRGANGVIIITTKRGQVSKARITLESQAGIQAAYGKIPLMNSDQWIERYREGLRMSGIVENELDNEIIKAIGDTEWANYKAGVSTDWQDLILQNGWQQKHQLSVQGGTEAVQYNIAFNVFNQEGMIPTRKFDRYTLRPNIDINFSKNFKVGLSTLLSYNKRHSKMYYASTLGAEGYASGWNDAAALPPTATPYDAEGNLLMYPGNTTTFYVNPLLDLKNDSYRWENIRYGAFINLYAEWQILPSLLYRLNLGTDVTTNSNKTSAGSDSNYRRGKASYAYIRNSTSNRYSIENILTYNKLFNDIHQLTLTGIHSYHTSHMEDNDITVNNLPYDPARWYNIGAASTVSGYDSDLDEWKLLSFAGRAFYGLKDKYLLTLSIRADGATQFADNHKWGYFPSAALAWRISEESFMKVTNKWLSNLKLRLSYGVSGNQGISPYQTQGSLSGTTYAFDEGEAYGLRPGDLANKDLKWETTAVYNLGLDFGLLDGRINGNVELYKSRTTDLLMYRNLPITSGFAQVLENVGVTQNKGVEVGLHTLNIKKKYFSWNRDLSFYLNREKIVELYNGKIDDVGSGWFIGRPIEVFYDYKKIGIWQLGEEEEAAKYNRVPGQIKIQDTNEDGSITDADRVILGSRQPDFVLSLLNTFRYRDWDLSFSFNTRWGQTNHTRSFGIDAFTNTNKPLFNYWTPTNPTNEYPRPDQSRSSYLEGSSLQYRDGSFIRLRTLSLGYTLPKDFVNSLYIQNVRVYFTGDNLWYWTKAEYRDMNLEPEWAGDNSSSYTDLYFPASRTFIIGLNITF